MSIKSTDASSKPAPGFTYDPITRRDLLNLIGAGPYKYCRIMQPKQCKGDIKDPDLQKRCMEMYMKCVAEAKRFELWHRMN